jgi:hypothetical protein
MALIFSNDFQTFELAEIKMHSFEYGEVEAVTFGHITLGDTPTENTFFRSETPRYYYQYTIAKHIDFYRLKVYRTFKNKMITGAITGNLEMFSENFADNEKMREFSLRTAIEHGQWNIVEYLIKNYNLKEDPLNYAIRWKQLGIVKNLLTMDCPLSKDWLAFCIHHDSHAVAKELFVTRKLDFNPREAEHFFITRLRRNSDTARLVKACLVSMWNELNECTQVNLKSWIEDQQQNNPNIVNFWITNN